MKITSIERFPITYQFSRPGAPKQGRLAKGPFDTVLVRIHTDRDIYGVGEAPAHKIYLGDTNPQILKSLDLIEQVIVGEDPWEIGRLHQKMREAIGSGPSRVPEAARAAVDMALWDIMGKDVGKPVYKLLGGGFRTTFNIFGTEYGLTFEEHMAEIDRCLQKGFTGCEVKLYIYPEEITLAEVQKRAKILKRIMESVPEDFEIMADCNLRWGPASNVILMVKGYGLEAYPNLFLEQPVSYADLTGLQKIRSSVSCPIIADESAISLEMVYQLGVMQAVDVICIKLPRVGGLYPARQIVTVAEAAGMGVKTDSGAHGLIGDTATVHLASCSLHPHPISDGWTYLDPMPVIGGVQIENGTVTLPETPGLGVDIDESIVASMRWNPDAT